MISAPAHTLVALPILRKDWLDHQAVRDWTRHRREDGLGERAVSLRAGALLASPRRGAHGGRELAQQPGGISSDHDYAEAFRSATMSPALMPRRQADALMRSGFARFWQMRFSLLHRLAGGERSHGRVVAQVSWLGRPRPRLCAACPPGHGRDGHGSSRRLGGLSLPAGGLFRSAE